jgi:hypothetical protein
LDGKEEERTMSDLITLGKPVRLGTRNGRMLPFRPAAVSPYGHPAPKALGQTGVQSVFDNTIVSLVFDAGGAAIGVAAGVKMSGAWSTVGWVLAAASFLRFMSDLSKVQVGA